MKKNYLLFLLIVLTFSNSTFSQYFYSQWSRNLVVGNNTFNISNGSSTYSNWTPGIQAISPELLSNSVTIHNGSNIVSVQIIKSSTTEFIVNVGTAISKAIITAQYPGQLICTAPTLISAVRSTTDSTQVTYTWNNNGMNFNTINLQYSSDGGATWTGNSGTSVSPRIITVPCTANKVRIIGYANGCATSGLVSNVLDLNTCCIAPTLISAVRSTTDSTQVTYTWNNNGMNFTTINLQYSTDGGTTWVSNIGSTISPRTTVIPCLNNVLTRVVGYSSNCSSSGLTSNIITLNCSNSSGYTFQATQAIGNYSLYTSPTTNSCGSVCATFGSTNLMGYLLSSVSPNSPIGAQIYFKLDNGTYVPANSTNCSLYGSINGTPCNKIETGIRWARFSAASNSNIYNVNPSTGVVESIWGTCQ